MTNASGIEIQQLVRTIIEQDSTVKIENGRYQVPVYVDHTDGLSEQDLRFISGATNKREAFYDTLADFAQHSIDVAHQDLLAIVKANWPVDAPYDYDMAYDDIIEHLEEQADYDFPYDELLKKDVLVNCIIDTGDGNYDFTLNNFASYNAVPNEKVEDESSLLWLVKKQGYKKSDLNRLIRKRETQDSMFLKSLLTEAENVTSHMNALAFFVKMPLGDFIDFQDKGKAITFSKDTPCGLYDCWSGAGGPLEIRLEKEVVVPAKFAQLHIEGTRGYGVDSIYGMFESFWKKTVVKVDLTV